MLEIEDFYVITDGGLCLYAKTRKAETGPNRDLLAGFMSALQTFAKQMDSAGVDAFTLGSSKFIFLKVKELYFVAKVPTAAKDKDVRKELIELGEIFLKNIPADFTTGTWSGNLKEFRGLDENFSRFLCDTTEKMRAALW
jgi:hypothetical protein